MRTRGIIALEWPLVKYVATKDLNHVLGCTSLTVSPSGSQMNKKLRVSLLNKLQPAHVWTMFHAKSIQVMSVDFLFSSEFVVPIPESQNVSKVYLLYRDSVKQQTSKLPINKLYSVIDNAQINYI